MNNYANHFLFYNEVINLVDLKDYKGAISYIRNHLKAFDCEHMALAYLNCGFLNNKLDNYSLALEDFSKAIFYEESMKIIKGRSKDISYSGRSDSKFKLGDFKGAIKDKRIARDIRLSEEDKSVRNNDFFIDYKNLLMDPFDHSYLNPKYLLLFKIFKSKKRKYDLINDYKNVISKKKKEEVIKRLEFISYSKYKLGDYKGSIKALRRAEKYY